MIQNADDYFDMARSASPLPVNQASQAIPEVVDANGDGIKDILTFGAYYPFNGSSATGQPALLMLGKGDGTYTPAPEGMLPSTFTTIHPREVIQADFNKDGLMDLFVADHGYDAAPFPGAQNKLLLGKAGGGYIDASANLPQVVDYTHSAALGDINRDGNLDIFVGNMSSPASPTESYVLFGDGIGKFTRSNAGLPVEGDGLLNRQNGGFGFTASLLTDLNGDGRLDLILGNDGNPYNREHRSLVFWNTGAGFNGATFTPCRRATLATTASCTTSRRWTLTATATRTCCCCPRSRRRARPMPTAGRSRWCATTAAASSTPPLTTSRRPTAAKACPARTATSAPASSSA